MPGTKTSAKPLQILKTTEVGFEQAWEELCCRLLSETEPAAVKRVQAQVEDVCEHGDTPLYALLESLCEHVPEQLELTPEEWEAGCEAVDVADRAALGKAAMRIREFHRKRIPGSWEVREEGGGYMGQRVRPLSRVGIFASADAPLDPSQVIMYATPASAVEVPEILLAVAPDERGTIRPEILMAARVAGVHRVFRMTGAGAMAAFAFGTPEVPRVERLVGPGGLDVDVAKRQLGHEVGILACPAPRELCIVADKTAKPTWLAMDLLGQAQVGDTAHALLITHCKSLPARVQDQVSRQLTGLSGVRKLKQMLSARSAIVVTRNLKESLELADRYAPEHLVAAVDKPEDLVRGVQNAGVILMGHYTPAAVGDYLAGPGAVLPSGGSARFSSPLCVEDFLKRTNFVKFEPNKLRELGAEAIRLAEVDGLSARGASVELRLKRIRRARREREVAREAEL
ncbi:MAG: histidinol dehydrogenase [Myxococcota bacterium]